MADQRKATEILLDIESRVSRIEGEIKLYNAGQALILKKLNEALSLREPETEAKKTLPVPSVQPPIEVETNFQNGKRIGRDTETKATNADITFKEFLVQKAQAQEQQKKASHPSGKKLPVVQKIQDTNGKDIFMANIVIAMPDGTQVFSTKTNAMGKWQAQLQPGTYQMRIGKTENSTGKRIDITTPIIIPDADGAVELKTLVVER